MARRAQSSLSPIALIIGAVFLLASGIGGYFLLGSSRTPKFPVLNIEDFRLNSLSLRGNAYLLSGSVDRRDRITATGQLITLAVGKGNDVPRVPVLIPANLKGNNIETGQSLKLVITINKDGVPEATQILD